MKELLWALTLLIFPFNFLHSQGGEPEDIILTTQSQIDDFQSLFGPCEELVGNLVIHDDESDKRPHHKSIWPE